MQRDVARLPPFAGRRVAHIRQFAQGDQSCLVGRERAAGNAAY
jgi:hypothetical protein